jgi:hypothetical protein
MAQLEDAAGGPVINVKDIRDYRAPSDVGAITTRRKGAAAAKVRQAAGIVEQSDQIKLATAMADQQIASLEHLEQERDRQAVTTLRVWLKQMATSARIVRHATECIAECDTLSSMAFAAGLQTDAMTSAMECWFGAWCKIAEELDRLNRSGKRREREHASASSA